MYYTIVISLAITQRYLVVDGRSTLECRVGKHYRRSQVRPSTTYARLVPPHPEHNPPRFASSRPKSAHRAVTNWSGLLNSGQQDARFESVTESATLITLSLPGSHPPDPFSRPASPFPVLCPRLRLDTSLRTTAHCAPAESFQQRKLAINDLHHRRPRAEKKPSRP